MGSKTKRATGRIRVTAPTGEGDTSTSVWDYSPAPERTEVAIADTYGLYVNGRFASPKSRKSFETINPANEKPLARVAAAGPADVDAAVAAATEALPGWARMRPRERAKYIYRIARRIQERARELAVLESMDGGKREFPCT